MKHPLKCPHGSPPRVEKRIELNMVRHYNNAMEGDKSSAAFLRGWMRKYPPCVATIDGVQQPYPDPVEPDPGGTGTDPDTPPGGTPVALRLVV